MARRQRGVGTVAQAHITAVRVDGRLETGALEAAKESIAEALMTRAWTGVATRVCADGRTGQPKWRTTIDGAPWGGLQAGVDTWTFGRFTRRQRGLDVYVGVHRRAKNSGEGWGLRGDTGAVVWRQSGLTAGTESAMPFGSALPAVADLNGDSVDDLEFLGRSLIQQGRADRALDALRRGVELAPEAASLRFWLVVAYERSGRPDLARTEAATLLRLHPEVANRLSTR